jgi:hypothetical protein
LGIEGSTGFTLFLHDFVNQLHKSLLINIVLIR